jgi:tetratricopeptide (TPR) repeat protein
MISREIFRLRKQGKLQEALNLALNALENDPDDMWVATAYAWVLYSLGKNALQNNDLNLVENYVNEFDELNVLDEEGFLENSFNYLRQQLNPNQRRLRQAAQLEREGNHGQALAIYRELLPGMQEDSRFSESYGWALYRALKDKLESNEEDTAAHNELLTEYLPVNAPKPSILHSLMLGLACKVKRGGFFDFIDFFENWGYTNLRPEDFSDFIFEEKEYPGIAEKALMRAGKEILADQNVNHIDDFMHVLDTGIQLLDDNIWLLFYKARILMKLGKNREAIHFIKPVVKEKFNEFWIWDLLGDAYLPLSKEMALSCFCKALTCHAEDKYMVELIYNTAALLHELGYDNEAKTAYEKLFEIRIANGWPLSMEMEMTQQESWYIAATTLISNKSFYRKNKQKAEKEIFADLPWILACAGHSFTMNKSGKRFIKIFIKQNNAVAEMLIKRKSFKILKELTPGDPLKIKAEKDGKYWDVFMIEKRNDATSWDIIPEYIGVVDHVNPGKKLFHVIIDKYMDSLVFTKKQNIDIKPGDFVALRLIKSLHNRDVGYSCLDWKKTAKESGEKLIKPFSGLLKIPEGKSFGFVDHVFIDPATVKKHGLQQKNESKISGMAIINYNKTNLTWGWKALLLDQ